MKRLLITLILPILALVAIAGAGAAPAAQTPGPCIDWNGRGGCGADDHFFELLCRPVQSLAGWSVIIADDGGDAVCDYTFKPDNRCGPLQVIFADEMRSAAGGGCAGFPLDGVAYLYDANGSLVDTRAFVTTVTGWSWQAVDWQDPAGAWQAALPNPGQ